MFVNFLIVLYPMIKIRVILIRWHHLEQTGVKHNKKMSLNFLNIRSLSMLKEMVNLKTLIRIVTLYKQKVIDMNNLCYQKMVKV